jgi:hypothetical protein
MTRRPVSSASIASVGYDAATQQFEVEFANGGVYQYADVPSQLFDSLMAAPSIGKHFQSHVRGLFPHTRIGHHEKGPRG